MTRADASVMELSGCFGVRSVQWLRPWDIGSAAFWIDQTRRSVFPASPRIGQSFPQEVAACMLGGYGITGEMTVAAFNALHQEGLLDDVDVSSSDIETVLRRPLQAEPGGSSRHYRFPAQRAERLSHALRAAHAECTNHWQPTELRRWLLELPGIGPKTASWIVRNTLDADDIAVVDIHIRRAGIVAGVFDPSWSLDNDYDYYEAAFCAWACAGEVPAWQLDSCIWNQLAAASRIGVRLQSERE